MKTILITVIFFICFDLCGQTKTIKVKKTVTQDQMASVVTLGGLYYGNISQKKLFTDRKFRISNNKDNLRILSFDITFGAKGNIRIYSLSADSLTPELIEELNKRDPKIHNKIFITAIKAVNDRRDTIFLNPIELKLISD